MSNFQGRVKIVNYVNVDSLEDEQLRVLPGEEKEMMKFKTKVMMMTLAVVVMIVTDCLATHPKVEEQVRGR